MTSSRIRAAIPFLVHGKGDKQRVVPISDDLANAIREYCLNGYLFPGQIEGHISAQWVGATISELMPPGWSMHKLRHRFSVATTQRYTAVATDEVRAAAMSAAFVGTD